MQYYTVDNILKKTDLNGNKPEILLSTGNRSAGKSVAWNKYAFTEWKDRHGKFILLVRYTYELNGIGERFFKDLQSIFYPEYFVESAEVVKNVFSEIYCQIGEEKHSIGYAIPLNKADVIKKYAHVFNDVTFILFDEFQSETKQYLSDEVNKFISIHQSVARGKGKQSRYVLTVLVGNRIDLLCPYLIELGISARLKKDTKYLRGVGFVYEQILNESAQEAQSSSLFNQAFKNDYMERVIQSKYLDEDCYTKPSGFNKYICTLRFQNRSYSISIYSSGNYHVSTKFDQSYPVKYAVTANDINNEYILNDDFEIKKRFIYIFNRGQFTFENAQCKDCLLHFLN